MRATQVRTGKYGFVEEKTGIFFKKAVKAEFPDVEIQERFSVKARKKSTEHDCPESFIKQINVKEILFYMRKDANVNRLYL
jgi:hypothetical protein